jgi:hypothetical protein
MDYLSVTVIMIHSPTPVIRTFSLIIFRGNDELDQFSLATDDFHTNEKSTRWNATYNTYIWLIAACLGLCTGDLGGWPCPVVTYNRVPTPSPPLEALADTCLRPLQLWATHPPIAWTSRETKEIVFKSNTYLHICKILIQTTYLKKLDFLILGEVDVCCTTSRSSNFVSVAKEMKSK